MHMEIRSICLSSIPQLRHKNKEEKNTQKKREAKSPSTVVHKRANKSLKSVANYKEIRQKLEQIKQKHRQKTKKKTKESEKENKKKKEKGEKNKRRTISYITYRIMVVQSIHVGNERIREIA